MEEKKILNDEALENADGGDRPVLMGPIAVAAYSYMALVPVIQPPIMNDGNKMSAK